MAVKKGLSAVQRTLRGLREQGYFVDKVEWWNSYAMRRIDPFNFIDILAIGIDAIIAVQCCVGSGHADHKRKILENEYAYAWLKTGNKIELWSWSKRKKVKGGKLLTWTPRVENISLEDFKYMSIKEMVNKLKQWEKERRKLNYEARRITEKEKKHIELVSNINSIKHAIGDRMLIEKMVIDSSKLDKALDLINKRVERRGNKWCVVHCTGPDAGKAIKCFPTKEQAMAMHRAIQVNKQAKKPPKAEWDRCENKARGIASIKDPAAYCGNLWYNDRSKWNAFIKEEEKKSKCGCPVNKTITAKSIKKLDNTLKLIEETQKKKPNKKVNK